MTDSKAEICHGVERQDDAEPQLVGLAIDSTPMLAAAPARISCASRPVLVEAPYVFTGGAGRAHRAPGGILRSRQRLERFRKRLILTASMQYGICEGKTTKIYFIYANRCGAGVHEGL